MTNFVETYLMVAFCCKTKLPTSIDTYSEPIHEMVREYVPITSLKWNIFDNLFVTGKHSLSSYLLKTQLEQGVYDECFVKYEDKAWTVKECKDVCKNEKCQMCTSCCDLKTLKLMAPFSFCGSDEIDRINCWQKCWDCQSLLICLQCIVRCDNCCGTYCANCFKKHPYVATFIQETCSKCTKSMNLETSPNVCGFDADPNTNYWSIFDSKQFLCMDCDEPSNE